MEFFATIKPYETGATHANPANSPRILAHPGLPGVGGVYIVDDWVLARPELRVKARAADLPVGIDDVPVRRIQLRQKDMAPVRIGRENLEIWTSADNVGYSKKDVSFDLTESVAKCPEDVHSMQGDHVTSKGDSVRVLDLTGLDLQDPFIAVTTTFDDDEGTFANTASRWCEPTGPAAGGYRSSPRATRPCGDPTGTSVPATWSTTRASATRSSGWTSPTRAPDRPAPTA